VDEHISTRKKREQNTLAVRVREVQLDTPFAAIEPNEIRGLAVDGGVILPREVTITRALELNNVGAKVCEMTRTKGSGNCLLERDHPHAR
jgi:hypothetical protein